MNKRELLQKDASDSIINSDYKGITLISPRFGKSKMLIDSIRDKSEWNICISSPRDDIRISWENEIIQWELGFDIKLICSASLKNIDSNLDLLVIDEIQMLSPGQINYIIKKKPKRLLGLTGTLDLSTQINLKRRLGLDIIYSYSIEQAIEDNIISNFEVNVILCNFDNEVIDIPSGIKKNPILTTEQGHSDFLHKQYNKFWTLSQQDYTFSSVKEYYARIRKNFIYTSKSKLEIAKKIIDKFERCMIFSGGIEQAEYLSEYTHHSKNKKNNNLLKFQEEEINKLGVVGCGILGGQICYARIHLTR